MCVMWRHFRFLFPLTVLLCTSHMASAQPGQAVTVTPDCQLFLSFSTAGTTANLDNRYVGCVSWTLQYTSTGFSGLTLTFQSAQGAVTPGTFGNYAGTTVTGANPMTSTTGEVSTFANMTVNIPWVNVKLSGLSGSGNVTGVLYGYKSGGGGGGGGGGGASCPGVSPCVVIGPTASGSPQANAPVQVAGNDGTDVRNIATDTSGNTQVTGAAAVGSAATAPVTTGFRNDSGNVLAAYGFPDQADISLSAATDAVIVAGVASTLTYVSHVSIAANSATTVTIQQGTGTNCGTNTVVLAGPYQNAAALALDFDVYGALHTTVTGRDLCLHFGASVTAGGEVTYGQH
jgi:hypothetical protein